MPKSYHEPRGTTYNWDHLGTTERVLTSRFGILEGIKLIVHLWDGSSRFDEKLRPEITVRLLYNGSRLYTWRPECRKVPTSSGSKVRVPPPETPKNALDVRIQERLRDFAQELQAEVSELQQEAMKEAHVENQLESALDDDLVGTITDLGEKLQELDIGEMMGNQR